MGDNLQVMVYSASRNAEVLTTLYLSINNTLDHTNLATLSITELQVAVETTLDINYIQVLLTIPQNTILHIVPFLP